MMETNIAFNHHRQDRKGGVVQILLLRIITVYSSFWFMLSLITYARFERVIGATSMQQLNTSAKPNQLSEFETKVRCRQWPSSYLQSFVRSLLSQK